MRDKRTTAPTYGLMVRICRLLVVGGILLMDVFSTLLVPESYSEVLMHVDAARFSASEGPDDAEVVALLGDALS